ncbi:MAG: 4-hydroxy-tetrahydrodipicolinate synthase [Pseudomonadales bacterium]
MFKGSIVALVTPMEANGDVDWDALERLLGWHLEQGTDGIVPMGTTGESATLGVDDHLKVIERTVAVVAKQVPVIAGTGANATWEAIHQTRRAEQLGADACLLVTPYYNRPTQAGLVAHYKALAEAAAGPLVLYNVPPRTACDMLPETVAEVAQFDAVVGIKEACGDAERVADIKALVNDDFVILSGEDAQTLRMLELGAMGTISVTANVLPRQMSEFCSAFLAGDVQRAAVMDADLQRMHAALFIESSPTPTKWALQEMGMIGPGIRLPLLPLSADKHAVLRAELEFAGCLQ